MAKDQHRKHDGEELSRRGNGCAHQRVEVADGEIDKVLAERRRQGETQHRTLTNRMREAGTRARHDVKT